MARLLTLTFLVAILASCSPEQPLPTTVRDSTDSDITNTDSNIPGAKDPDSDNFETVKWFSSNKYNTTLTIDSDNKQSVYLRGDDIYNYLINSTNFVKSYCAVINFTANNATTPAQLRILVSPQKVVNYVNGEIIYYFRMNLNTESGNSSCNVSYEALNPTTNSYELQAPAAATIVYKPADVCPTCTNILSSSEIKLYQLVTAKSNSAVKALHAVKNSDVSMNDLTLRLNINNDTNNDINSCTNTECIALGYNCCQDGQCINNGEVKDSVDQMSVAFKEADAEKNTNPNWYKSYPQYYYACLEAPPTSADGSDDTIDPENPDAEAAARLAALIEDYKCTLELDANTVTEPFHKDINTSFVAATCILSAAQSSQTMYYQNVMKRLYTNCGCSRTTLAEMINFCPAYTYKPIYVKNNQGLDTEVIQNIICQSPEPETDKLPFQDLSVIVNSRMAPHRYFNVEGDDLSQILTNNLDLDTSEDNTQEGDEFRYLDDGGLLPLSSAFSINSILGQMNVSLDQARPAKVVELEYDKVYYVAVLSGYYTHCPSCAKDSWFTNFSANPNSTQGVGLQSVGYTTKRDEWHTNYKLGNYEDTIFGRACWVPPTMIPWSHKKNGDVQTQRANRLKTQSALFANGYQRDWYGFNKGAVIGSFDGVTWFAVGKGRIVTSTSTKLFLAINAPFADLAEPTDHIVQVSEYDFISSGSRYDFDPEKDLSSTYQNEAGTCQAFHLCDTDADCITQLGWEYVCASPYSMKSKWPVFDANDASEKASEERASSIVFLLQQAELAGDPDQYKRCVYRGAGAPCRTDAGSISSEATRRMLTCAPNFYCAPVSTNAIFNSEVARFAAPLENLLEPSIHFFGQDAYVLGRPKNYVAVDGNLSNLPSEVISTLRENVLFEDPSATNSKVGLCRPGRSLPSYNASATGTTEKTNNWDPRSSHQLADTKYRTDYISQIGGCNSGLKTRMRYASCPTLDTNGNYIHLDAKYITGTSFPFKYSVDNATVNLSSSDRFSKALQAWSFSQNSCGMEELHADATTKDNKAGLSTPTEFDADLVRDYSPMTLVEGRTLASEDVQVEPTFARDACFRKAGAVCHTDYDCFPNKRHSDLIDIYGVDYFGNEAEMNYIREYLVCGQAADEPIPGDADYANYYLQNNRCCRELGMDITMYTTYGDTDGVAEQDEIDAVPNENEAFLRTLNPNKVGGLFPTDKDRYSRYSSLVYETLNSSNLPNSTTFVSPSAHQTGLAKRYQWKTIGITASNTCCGGGWVRKFADGTNNWSVKRGEFDIENFACLNYRSPVATVETDTEAKLLGVFDVNQLLLSRKDLCSDPTFNAGGCALSSFDNSGTVGDVVKPAPFSKEGATIDIGKEEFVTRPASMQGAPWANNDWVFTLPISADFNPFTYLPWSLYPDGTPTFRTNVKIYLPAWVTWGNSTRGSAINKVDFKDVPDPAIDNKPQVEIALDDNGDPGNFIDCVEAQTYNTIISTGQTDPVPATSYYHAGNDACGEDNACCWEYDINSRILTVAYNIYDDGVAPAPTNAAGTANDPSDINNFGPDTANGGAGTGVDLSLRIRFFGAGSPEWEETMVKTTTSVTDTDLETAFHRRGMVPGNIYYYLERLARFELTGIPQMTYLPIMCNNNYFKMVPGLFNDDIEWFQDFKDNGFNDYYNCQEASIDQLNGLSTANSTCAPYDTTNSDTNMPNHLRISSLLNSDSYVVTQQEVKMESIWSANDFMCCAKLGSTTKDPAKCCSGHGVAASGTNTSNATYTCKLPKGADVSVYLNRFITNEGIDEDLGTDSFAETDFHPKTGEPFMTSEVITKVNKFAQTHCENGSTIRGAAFGDWAANVEGYTPQFGSGTIYGIVDSEYDQEISTGTPRTANDFVSGLRWNHHIYCN